MSICCVVTNIIWLLCDAISPYMIRFFLLTMVGRYVSFISLQNTQGFQQKHLHNNSLSGNVCLTRQDSREAELIGLASCYVQSIISAANSAIQVTISFIHEAVKFWIAPMGGRWRRKLVNIGFHIPRHWIVGLKLRYPQIHCRCSPFLGQWSRNNLMTISHTFT